MSPQVGAFDVPEDYPTFRRFSDAMHHNAFQLQQATGTNPGPFLVNEWNKVTGWVAERNRAIQELLS